MRVKVSDGGDIVTVKYGRLTAGNELEVDAETADRYPDRLVEVKKPARKKG